MLYFQSLPKYFHIVLLVIFTFRVIEERPEAPYFGQFCNFFRRQF